MLRNEQRLSGLKNLAIVLNPKSKSVKCLHFCEYNED